MGPDAITNGNRFITSILNSDKKIDENGDEQKTNTRFYNDVPQEAVLKAKKGNVFGAAAAYGG